MYSFALWLAFALGSAPAHFAAARHVLGQAVDLAASQAREGSRSLCLLLKAPTEIPEAIRLLNDPDVNLWYLQDRLTEFSSSPLLRPTLAGLIADALDDTQTTAAARSLLQQLQLKLPPPTAPQPGNDQIDHLLADLESSSYQTRAAAASRLTRAMLEPRNLPRLLDRINHRMVRNDLLPGEYLELNTMWEECHLRWLSADERSMHLPPVRQEVNHRMIQRLIDANDGQHDVTIADRVNEREITDLLVRADTSKQTLAEIESRLASREISPTAALRLQQLRKRTRHGVSLELWQAGHCVTQMYFELQPDTTKSPDDKTYDWATDHFLQCETDDVLPQGNYLLGVAWQSGSDFFVYGVNLATVRSRLIYEYELQLDPRQRLNLITRHTVERIIDDGLRFRGDTRETFDSLDAREISRYAEQLVDVACDHEGEFCSWLMANGAVEALPGLTRAIANQRTYAQSSGCRMNTAWLAALMIARRYPGAASDNWLARWASCDDSLEFDSEAEIGATAAATLLERRHENWRDYGIVRAKTESLGQYGLTGYSFNDSARREKVARWLRATVQPNGRDVMTGR